jgi:stage II sporulation protein D
MSLSEISQKLTNLVSKTTVRELVGIDAKSYTASGRIARLRLAWNDGSQSFIAAHEFRMAVGHDQIKSTNFKLNQLPGGGADAEIEFVGQGFGHGVGMCQWGAKAMAQAGQSYQTILSHYYPRAHLKPLAALGSSSLSAAVSE